VQRVVDVMSRVEPDTVFTFGPDGMTGHPDHQAVCRWTTAAFEKVAKPGARLFYATKTVSFDERFRSVPTHQMVFGEAGPPRTPDHETAIACRLHEEILDLKVGALRAQVSQIEILHDNMGADTYREWVAIEWFTLAATG
jgi:LmbE family N-acetylglucosaminyl deacetylase